jgi:hypothetical protein
MRKVAKTSPATSMQNFALSPNSIFKAMRIMFLWGG